MSQAEITSLEESYMMAFSTYSNREIQDAVQIYLSEGEFFPPRPYEIIKRIKSRSDDKHTKELVDLFTCSVCHQKTATISEGVCLDCKGIPTLPSNRIPMPVPEIPDYKMEGRVQCSECGTVGMCIKEPRETGAWRCRKCYTGLTNQEIAKRWRDIVQKMNTKSYKADWMEEPPF